MNDVNYKEAELAKKMAAADKGVEWVENTKTYTKEEIMKIARTEIQDHYRTYYTGATKTRIDILMEKIERRLDDSEQ